MHSRRGRREVRFEQGRDFLFAAGPRNLSSCAMPSNVSLRGEKRAESVMDGSENI